ncbi:MAG: thioesterase [Chitinophagaceae bacterium]
MTPSQQKFLSLARNPFKMGFFMLTQLPAAFFSGVRVNKIESSFSEITVPFFWFSKNPFRSTYFACLAMAAEMSSGLLALLHVYRSNPSVSMLVLTVKGNFHKKATGKTIFRCKDGALIEDAVKKAKETGEGITVESISKGYNEKGELVADFTVLWTFKAKN